MTYCEAGICADVLLVDCDDGVACTADGCDPQSGCSNAPNDGACETDCQTGTCDVVAGCQLSPGLNFQPCDDGDPCQLSDFCLGGQCVAGQDAEDCDDGDPCTTDHCSAAAGGCWTATADADGAPCNDGDACTFGESCQAGVCGDGLAVCDDGDECTSDSCADGVCSHVPLPPPCGAGTNDQPPYWLAGATLAVESVTPRSVTLVWTAASDDEAVTGYRLRQDGEIVAEVPATSDRRAAFFPSWG